MSSAVPGTELLRSDHGDHQRVRRFALEVLEGPDAGRTATPTADRAVIGTQDGVELQLTDRAVSRFHCELAVVDDGVQVRDLGSTNGTRVAGVRLGTGLLEHGAELTVGRTRVRVRLTAEHETLALATTERFGLLVGRSPAMRRLFAELARVAATDASVLLLGETGTGKELAAESLHREGARAAGPFVVVDCGAIPPSLLESELFGHEKGAFTGAIAERIGAFEQADGGTVFLDEIGELPTELQPKLLRVLERREVKRVGASKHQSVDVRIVAATHRDLRAMVNAQKLRADLYYRLAVVTLTIPALRARTGDLPLLVADLLAALGKATHPVAELVRSPDFLEELARHEWPGNVRELRNYVETSLALHGVPAEGEAREGLPSEGRSPLLAATVPFKEARDRWVGVFERGYLGDLMSRHQGNASAAARAAGVDRAYLYRLLWRHGLR